MKPPEELLKHILDECDYLIGVSQGMDIEDLLSSGFFASLEMELVVY